MVSTAGLCFDLILIHLRALDTPESVVVVVGTTGSTTNVLAVASLSLQIALSRRSASGLSVCLVVLQLVLEEDAKQVLGQINKILSIF